MAEAIVRYENNEGLVLSRSSQCPWREFLCDLRNRTEAVASDHTIQELG